MVETEAPAVPAEPGVSFTEWSDEVAPRFFTAWDASFRDRPGFPGWLAVKWIDWISHDDDFRADWTMLASAGGTGRGFIAGGAGGWIVQVGVVPAARAAYLRAADG